MNKNYSKIFAKVMVFIMIFQVFTAGNIFAATEGPQTSVNISGGVNKIDIYNMNEEEFEITSIKMNNQEYLDRSYYNRINNFASAYEGLPAGSYTVAYNYQPTLMELVSVDGEYPNITEMPLLSGTTTVDVSSDFTANLKGNVLTIESPMTNEINTTGSAYNSITYSVIDCVTLTNVVDVDGDEIRLVGDGTVTHAAFTLNTTLPAGQYCVHAEVVWPNGKSSFEDTFPFESYNLNALTIERNNNYTLKYSGKLDGTKLRLLKNQGGNIYTVVQEFTGEYMASGVLPYYFENGIDSYCLVQYTTGDNGEVSPYSNSITMPVKPEAVGGVLTATVSGFTTSESAFICEIDQISHEVEYIGPTQYEAGVATFNNLAPGVYLGLEHINKDSSLTDESDSFNLISEEVKVVPESVQTDVYYNQIVVRGKQAQATYMLYDDQGVFVASQAAVHLGDGNYRAIFRGLPFDKTFKASQVVYKTYMVEPVLNGTSIAGITYALESPKLVTEPTYAPKTVTITYVDNHTITFTGGMDSERVSLYVSYPNASGYYNVYTIYLSGQGNGVFDISGIYSSVNLANAYEFYAKSSARSIGEDIEGAESNHVVGAVSFAAIGGEETASVSKAFPNANIGIKKLTREYRYNPADYVLVTNPSGSGVFANVEPGIYKMFEYSNIKQGSVPQIALPKEIISSMTRVQRFLESEEITVLPKPVTAVTPYNGITISNARPFADIVVLQNGNVIRTGKASTEGAISFSGLTAGNYQVYQIVNFEKSVIDYSDSDEGNAIEVNYIDGPAYTVTMVALESRKTDVTVSAQPVVVVVPETPSTPAPVIETVIEEEETPLGLIEYYEPYIKGYPDKSFRPEGFVTRAEVSAIFARILKLDLAASNSVFTDVPALHWSASYIAATNKLGLVVGYPDGTFKPNQAITRGELAAVIAKYWDVVKYSANAKTAPLSDISGHWAATAISKLYNRSLLNGFADGTFRPNDVLKREQLVVIINNLVNRPNYKNAIPSFTDTTTDDWYYGYVEAASAKFQKGTFNK